MPYERLTQLLSETERRPVEVTNAFVFKFGAFLLAESSPDEEDPNLSTARENLRQESWEPRPNMLEEIKAALEGHPNVFHLKPIDAETPLSVWGDRTGMLAFGPSFSMEIQLPRGRQKYQDMDTSEHFMVLWSGSYFGAYAPIEDTPIYTNIGHEFREIARKQIRSSTRYLSPTIGPSPVWTDIVVAQVKTARSSSAEPLRSFAHEDTLCLMLDERIDINDCMQDLFSLSHRYWYGYYELSARRSEHLETDAEIQNRFDESSQSVSKMATTPSWKIWQISDLATKAALEIGQMHRLLVQYEDACWGYDNNRREYLKAIQEVPHLCKLQRETAGECRRDFRPPASINAALEFLEKQIETARNIRSLLLASLMGAIVGSVITGLLDLIRNNHPH